MWNDRPAAAPHPTPTPTHLLPSRAPCTHAHPHTKFPPPHPTSRAPPPQVTWLIIQCDDRPGLLAEVANCIARHDHNITVGGSCGCGRGCGCLGPCGCGARRTPAVSAGPAGTHGRVAPQRQRLWGFARTDLPVAQHQHHPPIPAQAYSGSADAEAGLFVMEYELHGETAPGAGAGLCAAAGPLARSLEPAGGWPVGSARPRRHRAGRHCLNSSAPPLPTPHRPPLRAGGTLRGAQLHRERDVVERRLRAAGAAAAAASHLRGRLAGWPGWTGPTGASGGPPPPS